MRVLRVTGCLQKPSSLLSHTRSVQLGGIRARRSLPSRGSSIWSPAGSVVISGRSSIHS